MRLMKKDQGILCAIPTFSEQFTFPELACQQERDLNNKHKTIQEKEFNCGLFNHPCSKYSVPRRNVDVVYMNR